MCGATWAKHLKLYEVEDWTPTFSREKRGKEGQRKKKRKGRKKRKTSILSIDLAKSERMLSSNQVLKLLTTTRVSTSSNSDIFQESEFSSKINSRL